IEYAEPLETYLIEHDVKSFDYSQFCNIKVIGKGGYAIVYSASYEGEVYALKSLNNNLALGYSEYKQLKNE
ncbi:22250_t:CDS:1, partial [Racocetra persica]